MWPGPREGQWHYMQSTSRCTEWSKKDQPVTQEETFTKWNCTQIFSCSTGHYKIQRSGPVAGALRVECLGKLTPPT